MRLGELDRSRVGLRIVERDVNVQSAGVKSTETLGHVQGVAIGMAEPIEPALVVEPRRFHDELVTLPATNRIAQPGWIRVARKGSTVEEYLTKRRVLLVEKDDQSRALNDFER